MLNCNNNIAKDNFNNSSNETYTGSNGNDNEHRNGYSNRNDNSNGKCNGIQTDTKQTESRQKADRKQKYNQVNCTNGDNKTTVRKSTTEEYRRVPGVHIMHMYAPYGTVCTYLASVSYLKSICSIIFFS